MAVEVAVAARTAVVAADIGNVLKRCSWAAYDGPPFFCAVRPIVV